MQVTTRTTFLLGICVVLATLVSDTKSSEISNELDNGNFVIRSNVKGGLTLTASTNGVVREYTANATAEVLDKEAANQSWYVQRTVSYPALNIQLRLINTRGPNTYNSIDSELPPGSYYSYRVNWRLLPAKGDSFAIEFYSQLSFDKGSGLCLQNNGAGRDVTLVPCRTNKKNQQWTFSRV